MLFVHEPDTAARTFIAMDPARTREVLAVFESSGTAQSYARAFNDTHPWTNRATKARVIAPAMKPIEVDAFTVVRYVVVRGTTEREHLALFEFAPDGEQHVANADQAAALALYAVPFFHADALHPAPPEPGGQWSAAFFTADLALFGDLDGERHVLLVRRADDSDAYPGRWAFPGGFVELDETGDHAAVRETAEETGIKVPADALRLVAVADDPDRDPRGRIVASVYTAVLDHLPAPAAGDDAAEARWFPLDEAHALPLAFDHNKLLHTTATHAATLNQR